MPYTIKMSDTDSRAAVNEGLRPNFAANERIYKLRDKASGRVIERAGGAALEIVRQGSYEIVPWETVSTYEQLMTLSHEQLLAVYDSASQPLSKFGALERVYWDQKALAVSLVHAAENGIVNLEAANA